MGRIKNSIFGFPSGRIGNIVFFVRNGKPCFRLLIPKKRIIKSEKLKAVNYRFKTAAGFNSAIYKLKVIRELWEDYPDATANSTFNKMTRVNLIRVKPEYDISDLQLLPYKDKFETSVLDIQSGSGIISITASPYNENIAGSRVVSLQGVLLLTNPSDEKNKPFSFIPVHSRDIDLLTGVPLQFEVKLSNQDEELIKLYNEQKFLLNLIIKDTQGQPEKFSKEVYV